MGVEEKRKENNKKRWGERMSNELVLKERGEIKRGRENKIDREKG